MIKKACENIDSILSMKEHNAFQKYIDFIHFPFYRNMEINSRINFDFPLTVIVGQNGCGKSSVLHAIYGMPQGKTPYHFWFDTVVDPIIYYDDERRRHSFWYQYTENNVSKQVIKARIKREDNPNYWETSRPLQWANMDSSEREQPITKNVVYLDFRGELSAFDKFFYFGNVKHSKAKNKQEFIRNKSSDLSNGFNGSIKYSKTRALNKPVQEINPQELEAISYILGRNYSSAKSLYHSYFRNDGYSIIFNTNYAKYSEAFAGSGEMAVVRLVHEVLEAPDFSLIILDEPEVSLHPGAQRRLMDFLLEEIKKRKHQIILTTHSPSIIQDLPKESIIVLYQKQETGRFAIKENLLPEEAFYHIGFESGDKIRILFEDKLAREIFRSVLKDLGPEKEQLFKLDFQPGGCATLFTDFATVFCRENDSINYIVFDGDQNPKDKVDWRDLTANELSSTSLKNIIKSITSSEINFAVDGGINGGNEEQKIVLYKKYLDYLNNNIFYLPLSIPEEIIWSDDSAKKFLEGIFPNIANDNLEKLKQISNLKARFSELSSMIYGENDSDTIFNLQRLFINAWLQNKDENYVLIVKIIEKIIQS